MTWRFILAGAWSFVLLLACLSLPKTIWIKSNRFNNSWIWILFGALIARLVPLFLLPNGAIFDIESYQLVAGSVLQGQDVYTNPGLIGRHPYLPFQMYWMALSYKLANILHLPYPKIVKLAPIVADILIAFVILLILRRNFSPQVAFYGAAWYALNPIPIFVSAYHGQFDAVPALFLLLAFASVDLSSRKGGLWLGLAILDKSWPVLAFPSLLQGVKTWRNKFIFVLVMGSVLLLSVVFYALVFSANLLNIFKWALGYNQGIGSWGYPYLVRLLQIFHPQTRAIFAFLINYGRYLTLAALAFAWIWRGRKESPSASFLTILVTFFAVTHAFAIQYLMWLVPFAILNQQYKWLSWYTLAAFFYMFLAYFMLILIVSVTRWMPLPQADWFIIMPAGLPSWTVVFVWMIRRLFGVQTSPHSDRILAFN